METTNLQAAAYANRLKSLLNSFFKKPGKLKKKKKKHVAPNSGGEGERGCTVTRRCDAAGMSFRSRLSGSAMRKLNLKLEKADLQTEFLVLRSKHVKMSKISKRKPHRLMITSSEIQRDESRSEEQNQMYPVLKKLSSILDLSPWGYGRKAPAVGAGLTKTGLS